MDYQLTRTVTRIGRDPHADISLPDNASVSRLHAEIRRHGDQYVLRDLNSTNGSFVNEQRVTAPHTLHTGDRIRLGDATLVYGHGALLLPEGARPGYPAPGTSWRSRVSLPPPAADRSIPLFLLIGIIVVIAAAALLIVATSRPSADTRSSSTIGETTAKRWVAANIALITDEIARSATPLIELEFTVLTDQIRSRVSQDVWTYSDQGKVTENVRRVLATITFDVGMVGQPDNTISAHYVLTVDEITNVVKEHHFTVEVQ